MPGKRIIFNRCSVIVRQLALVALYAVVSAVAAIPACAIDSSAAHKPVRSLLEIRNQDVVHQQWDLSCGAATLATLLTYQHGDAVPEPQIAKAMLEHTSVEIVNQRGGFSLLDLKQYAEGRGYEAAGYSGLTVADLENFAPIIVPVSLSRIDHFVVFRGRVGDRVVLADPAFGNRTMRLDRFDRVWQNKVGFVVNRGGGGSPSNALAPSIEALEVVPAAAIRFLVH